jgi:hypothetical protein
MQLLAQGEVVLTPGVALSFQHLRLIKIRPLILLMRRKNKPNLTKL